MLCIKEGTKKFNVISHNGLQNSSSMERQGKEEA